MAVFGLKLACMYASRPDVNRFWFFNFNEAPSILDDYLKFLCVLGQIFSEILRVLEND
jgi:hypothetical protein